MAVIFSFRASRGERQCKEKDAWASKREPLAAVTGVFLIRESPPASLEFFPPPLPAGFSAPNMGKLTTIGCAAEAKQESVLGSACYCRRRCRHRIWSEGKAIFWRASACQRSSPSNTGLSQVRHALAMQKEDMQSECKEIMQARGPTLFVTRTRFSDILPCPWLLLAVGWGRRRLESDAGNLLLAQALAVDSSLQTKTKQGALPQPRPVCSTDGRCWCQQRRWSLANAHSLNKKKGSLLIDKWNGNANRHL